MEDNSNSPRVDDCGDGEEEEDRDQGIDDKKSILSQYSVEGTLCSIPPSSSRLSRNIAEKLRREKLNKCIQDLQTYVPLISNSSKKIEKTSVLRLSAAYLRLNRLLVGIKDQHEKLPEYIKKANVADLMLDGDDIYLMVTSSGKIVFVSHSVENILGYSQNDLMGESFYKISNPNDHEELKKNLTYEYETPNSGTSIIAGNDHLQNVKRYNRDNFKVQRRSFYLRLVKKASSRDEQPAFELVHVVGTLMIQNSGTKSSEFSENDIVLNAVVRPYNERCVTEVSMIESHSEEYITRHQIDGRIIYVDHRISIVSGFMPHEVCGQLAFQYMHIDDVRWVMIALRQMYYKGQSFGSSCYRLLSKNGEFVYMRTHGFLQLNTNDDTVESFICVNTLVPPEQGKKDIIEMKKRFTPLIIAASEPGIAAITYNQFMEKESTVTIEDITEDLKTLGKAVEQMITNIPEPAIDNIKVTAQNPGDLPDNQEYARVAALSKSIPLVSVASNAPKFCKQSSLSPRPSYKPIVQDRPSVLVAPRISRQPVLVYNHQTDEKTEKDRAYLERRGDIFVMPKRQNYSKSMQDNLPKKPKIASETQKTLDNDSLFMGPDSYDSFVPGVYDQGSSTDIIQDPLIQVLQHSKSFGSALLEEKQNTLKNKMDQQQGQLKEIQTELNLLSSNANTHFLAKDYSNLKAVIDHQQQALRELQEVHQNIGV